MVHLGVFLENILLRHWPTEHGSAPHIVLADYGAAAPFHVGAERCHAIDAIFAGYRYPHPVLRAEDVRCARRLFRHWSGKGMYRPPECFAGHPVHGPDADAFGLGVCLFLLLTGVLPFASAHESDDSYAYICSGTTDSLLHAWGKQDLVSAPALELVEGLLHHPSPSDRLTVDDALRHEWLADSGDSDASHVWILTCEGTGGNGGPAPAPPRQHHVKRRDSS